MKTRIGIKCNTQTKPMMSVYTAHDLLSRQFFRRSNLSLRFTTYTQEAFDTALLSSFTAALNSNSELKLTADVSVCWAELELLCCIFDCYSIHVYEFFAVQVAHFFRNTEGAHGAYHVIPARFASARGD